MLCFLLALELYQIHGGFNHRVASLPGLKNLGFPRPEFPYEFDVICLWEQPANFFLQYPGLLPFAALGQTNDPEATLRQVAQTVDQISDSITQANLTAASAILAGIVLREEEIYRLLRRDIMRA